MPARSNEFQKLITIINRTLASENTEVIESAMLYDSEAECDREVDILIKTRISGHEISIGVECTSTSRPVEIRVIESTREKHRKIGINKTIFVSKNGFTKTSKDYAKKNHIKLLTFNMTERENWSKIFEPYKNLSIYGRSYKIVTIELSTNKFTLNPDFDLTRNIQVLWKEKIIPITEFCAELWSVCGINKTEAKSLRENEINGEGEPWVEIAFDLYEKTIFIDCNGITALPNSIKFKMIYTSNYQDLNPKEVEYDESNYIVGAFDDKTKKQFAHFALREENGLLTGKLEASASIIPTTYFEKKNPTSNKSLFNLKYTPAVLFNKS